MKKIQRTFTVLLLFTIATAFKSTPDATIYFENGKKNCENKDFIKAISDFTVAISIKPDYGQAYLERAKAKIHLGEKLGNNNLEYCFDLLQALNNAESEASLLLQDNCQGQCYTLTNDLFEPEMVFCADLNSRILHALPENSRELFNLIHLNLFNNKFQETTNDMIVFKNLLYLDMSSNKLQNINSGIPDLIYLEELNLNKNELTLLPPAISNLKKLKKLYLRSNKLTFLPAEISNCTSLENIDLSFNQLNTLPAGISNLKKLHTLNLVGNPMDKKTLKEIKASLPKAEVYF